MSRISIPTLSLIGFLFATSASATILNVPQDYQTVTAAIDSAQAGDTVLVQPGTYREALNFGGKAITVAGRFFMSGLLADIDSVILDATDNETSVVRFDHHESADSRLIGFTLIHGYGSPDLSGERSGGGVHCLDSSPTLTHLKITNCSARYGAGIMVQRCSPVIDAVAIFDNQADRAGGGIYCSRAGCNPLITRALIHHNYAQSYGSAVGVYQGANPTFINCTLAGMTIQGHFNGEIGFYLGCTVRLVNCVIPSQEAANIGLDEADDTLYVSYSCLAGGQDNIHRATRHGIVVWEDGNLEVDPMFRDFDHGDLTPSWASFPTEDSTKSLIIDAGNPDSPEDADGSQADMGAIPFLRGGILLGTVRSAADGEAIPGARLVENYMPPVTADSSGAFFIRNHPAVRFDLLVSAPGYNDSLLTGLQLNILDTLTLDIRLLSPLLSPSPEELQMTLDEGSSQDYQIELRNTGNGRLEYRAESRAAGDWVFEIGRERESFPLQDVIDSHGIYAPVLVNDHYYIPGLSYADENAYIYVLDSQGALFNRLPQPSNSDRYGLRALAWDGEHLWGCFLTDTLISFDFDGAEVERTVVPGVRSIRNLAWDSNHRLLWVSESAGNIFAFDPQSNQIVDSADGRGLSLSGLGYNPEDPDGHPLYVRSNLHNSAAVLHKIRPGDSDTLLVAKLDSLISLGYGAFVAPDFDLFRNSVLISTGRGADGNYHISVVQISNDAIWTSVSPAEGTIEASHSANLTLTINATGLIPEIYPCAIRIQHNAPGFQTIVPFTVQVNPNSVSVSPLTPYTLHLSPCYPNPFNSTTSISFSLPKPGWTKVDVVDINGRLVERLTDGRLEAGEHRVVWNAGKLGSGVYLVRLENGSSALCRKVVLLH